MDNFKQILNCLPTGLRQQIQQITDFDLNEIEEIRMYRGRPVQILAKGNNLQLQGNIDGNAIMVFFNSLMKFSYYAYEEDISKGFITIDGGHRVGICGKTVVDKGKVTMIREISSLNIRHAKEVIGASKSVETCIYNGSVINNLLLVSPPGCGKTTLLRDIARRISLDGYKVAICDERSEIAGVFNGIPSYSFGKMTDILDGCPKAEGMIMLVRSMSPNVIITDEIGKMQDCEAIMTCAQCGVSIITTIHGFSTNDLLKSNIHPLIEKKVFQYIIFLTNNPSPGIVKEVLHG